MIIKTSQYYFTLENINCVERRGDRLVVFFRGGDSQVLHDSEVTELLAELDRLVELTQSAIQPLAIQTIPRIWEVTS
jgi:hypothetical protein